MSRENVDLALDMYDAFNRRDWDAFLALTHDEIEIESRLVAMEGGYHGHEGLRRWWDDFLGAFPDYTVEVEELRDLGDVTLGHIRGWGHGADSATPIVDPFWQPLRWRDGKCVWWRNSSTEAEALQASYVNDVRVAFVSSDNLAIVHTLLDGIDRPDFVELIHRLDQGGASGLAEFTPLFELVDPEIVWDTSALEIPDLGVFHGHEGVITWWRKWLAEWEDWSFEAKNFEEIRDQVVFDIVLRGRSRRMGAYAEFRQAHVVTLRAGKVVAYRVFKDRPEALAVT